MPLLLPVNNLGNPTHKITTTVTELRHQVIIAMFDYTTRLKSVAWCQTVTMFVKRDQVTYRYTHVAKTETLSVVGMERNNLWVESSVTLIGLLNYSYPLLTDTNQLCLSNIHGSDMQELLQFLWPVHALTVTVLESDRLENFLNLHVSVLLCFHRKKNCF
jgi:hypothetical protein